VSGTQSVGSGSGSAKEGISTSFDEDKGAATTGADGSLMISLHAGMTGKMTIRLLKTSPVNAILSQAFAFQRSSSGNWGQNFLRVVDKVRGDVATLYQAQFVKFPDNAWAEDGNVIDWVFQGVLNENLGPGLPTTAIP
jgi:hypothetical protein